MPDLLFFDTITDADAPRVGGKGFSLGRMAVGGLPVPPGFVVAIEAYRRLHKPGLRSDAAFAQAVLDAYHRLGGGPVAVRSSATAEDGAEASFAGQQETLLGVHGDDALLAAIERCWASLHTERAIAYRRQRNVDEDGLAMAVVVQTLVPAEVAGVLFTRDPQDPTGRLMAVEASWGLGEAVVSGRVTPDRFRLDHDSGAVVSKNAGRKTLQITAAGEEPVPRERQEVLCLSDSELSQLAELGRKVEQFYRESRDVEWAFLGGTFQLLQARPITTGSATEREAVRTAVIAELRRQADPKGTVWVRYNLSEVLPEPTPMTWAIVGRLLAADGGFGAMNRDLGATPDPSLGSEGAFDLVAGRPMMNLTRSPRLQFTRPPFEYPFAVFKADPRKALDPQPVMNPWRVGLLRLPGVIWQSMKMTTGTTREETKFVEPFTKDIAPKFLADARAALAETDWPTLSPAQLVQSLETWTRRTLIDFARDSLKPTVFATNAWTTLTSMLTPKLGSDRAKTAVGEIALGAHPPEDADFASGVRRLAAGELDRAAFLHLFGHRCQNEMELSQPRWSEDPSAVERLAAKAQGRHSLGFPSADPFAKLADELKLDTLTRTAAAPWAAKLRTYLGLREAAKHYLLLGHAVIRRSLVELDSRFNLRGGIFFLTPPELPDLLAGKDVAPRIAERRKRRQLELSLESPPVLFSDDFDAIGRPIPAPEGAAVLEGIALSAGVAEAAALVLTDPSATPPDEPFILVCPSTDPAWVPLFARAKGLVMETGGVLSHGAIVAREFGLPAVAGLPSATKQIRTGERIRVDGASGTVAIIQEAMKS